MSHHVSDFDSRLDNSHCLGKNIWVRGRKNYILVLDRHVFENKYDKHVVLFPKSVVFHPAVYCLNSFVEGTH